jgi:glycosyltransferase involved in cell wall biosynthesis
VKNIRLVHVVNFDLGLKIHIANYMRYQLDQGYDVSVVSHPGKWLTHDTTIQDGIPVKIIPFAPSITPAQDLKTLVRLINYFRKERFDIVHTSTVKPGLLGRIAAKLVGTPIIVHTYRGLYLHDQMSPFQRWFYLNIERIGTACCDVILSQNKEDIHTAITNKVCPPEKIVYLGNGIDTTRFDPSLVSTEKTTALRANLGIPPNVQVIGFVSRMVREKGVYELLQAAQMIKSSGMQVRYLTTGSSQSDKTTAVSPDMLLKQYGLEEEVMLLGHRDDIPELLSVMDVLVLPSYAEGIPRIVMEAATFGKPVVATRARGTVEIVEDGKTGLLVPVRDARALADGILKLLNNPAEAAQMGQRARQYALQNFDERQYFWKTDAEYRRLIKAKLNLDPAPILRPIPNA